MAEVYGKFHTDGMIDSDKVAAILERLRRIPIVDTLQMGAFTFNDGVCEVTVPRQTKYDGVFESFHGGILMTIADSIACFAVLTRTPADQALTTTDMNIRFLAPCLTDVHAKARVIKFGRVLCPVAVEMFDAKGTLVAVAQINYMLLSRMPRRP